MHSLQELNNAADDSLSDHSSIVAAIPLSDILLKFSQEWHPVSLLSLGGELPGVIASKNFTHAYVVLPLKKARLLS